MRKQYSIFALLLLILGATLPLHAQTFNVNLIVNGGFEAGFVRQAGCGDVGLGWQCFTNGGRATYGFYDEQWPPVVAEGAHGQLIEVNNKNIIPADNDRYAGLQQTVRVAKNANYTLSLQGMIRSNRPGPGDEPGRYRVQVGWTYGMTNTWEAVNNWLDVGWNNYYDRLAPGKISRFRTTFAAPDEQITIFVRVWKKWGVAGEELDVNLDNISLVGAPAPPPTPVPTRLAGIGWPRAYGTHFSFAYPGSWTPTQNAPGDPSLFETWQLGIPGQPREQLIGFFSTAYADIKPTDAVLTTAITIGGRNGTKWVRQGPDYVRYEYCTTGYADVASSFCAWVIVPVNNPMLELQMDRMINSVVFY